jgi:hypothetical protein
MGKLALNALFGRNLVKWAIWYCLSWYGGLNLDLFYTVIFLEELQN